MAVNDFFGTLGIGATVTIAGLAGDILRGLD